MIYQITEAQQWEPVAWLHEPTNQAFTNEPPPSLKARCLPLYTRPAPLRDLTDSEIDTVARAAGRCEIADYDFRIQQSLEVTEPEQEALNLMRVFARAILKAARGMHENTTQDQAPAHQVGATLARLGRMVR